MKKYYKIDELSHLCITFIEYNIEYKFNFADL